MKDKIAIIMLVLLQGKDGRRKRWQRSQTELRRIMKAHYLPGFGRALRVADEAGIPSGEMLEILAAEEGKMASKLVYNFDRADVAQLVEQLIRNQ